MTNLSEKDNQILSDYLKAYKECFRAMNNLLVKIIDRVALTEEEKNLAHIADMKYKNMLYHIRKWKPDLKK